jgi:hypothetical protein
MGVVEASPPFDPEALGHRDLDVRDVVPVPDRLQEGVGEAEEEQVLDRVLAQVVVDAEDRRLLEGIVQRSIERPSRFEVAAEGLLDHDARPCRAAGATQALDDRREGARRDGQVVAGTLCVAERLAQALEDRRVRIVPAYVAEQPGQLLEGLGVDPAPVLFDAGVGARLDSLQVPVLAADRNDGNFEPLALYHRVEGGKDLLVGEVPGRAEEHQGVRSALRHGIPPPARRVHSPSTFSSWPPNS